MLAPVSWVVDNNRPMTLASVNQGAAFWLALAGLLLFVAGIALLVIVDAPRRAIHGLRRRREGRSAGGPPSESGVGDSGGQGL